MNIKHLIPVAALSIVMASCSSDEPSGNNGKNPGTDESGESYVSIAINLPSTTGSRAVADDGTIENDNFTDGIPAEYAVANSWLVMFEGTDATEATAKITNKYKLEQLRPWNTEGTNMDNVTVTAQTTRKIQAKPENSARNWALVVLNAPSQAFMDTHFATGKTLEDITTDATITQADMNNANGFFMTNAPTLNSAGNAAVTLVNLSGKIFTTEEAAKNSPAVDIYVERGVAKVMVNKSYTDDQEINLGSEKAKVDVTAWNLDITNEKSNLVRNVDGINSWIQGGTSRFFSASSKRIYWARDINYDNTTDFNVFARANDANLTLGSSVYCLENTFNVAHMRQNETTRIIFKAQLKNADGEVLPTFFTIGNSTVKYTETSLCNLIKAQAVANIDGKADGTKYSVTLKANMSYAGTHHVENNTVTVTYDGTALTDDELEKIDTGIGNINAYNGGVCWYVGRIKHFGDQYCPWKSGDPTYGEAENAETAAKNYLGRYGVLRNNFYEITVEGIETLGSPTIPDPVNQPDDENTYFISFKVNMHSWAKRTQNIIL